MGFSPLVPIAGAGLGAGTGQLLGGDTKSSVIGGLLGAGLGTGAGMAGLGATTPATDFPLLAGGYAVDMPAAAAATTSSIPGWVEPALMAAGVGLQGASLLGRQQPLPTAPAASVGGKSSVQIADIYGSSGSKFRPLLGGYAYG